ncbi:MAG: hybrid sensor histidine kinase/response regulator [Polyangiales bacterium]
MQHEALAALASRYGITETLTGAVLVVDDDRENLAVLRAFLDGDYVVHEATDGAAALRVLAEHRVDVVIADQRMPGMTGVDLLEVVSQRYADTAGILLTAFTDTPLLIEAINRARVFRHLRKPWEPGDVLAAVAQATAHVEQVRINVQLLERLAQRSDELATTLEQLRAAQRQMILLERLGTMGRLAAGITHDLRNMVQILMMFEEQFERWQVPDRIARPFHTTVAAMRNLQLSLSTLQQYASSGRLAMERDPVDPRALLADAVTVMQLDASQREVSLSPRVLDGARPVPGDHAKLLQVMVNLLRNALQVSAAGGEVRVDARESPEGLVLGVEDDGPGVPVEVREHLFDPFVSTKGEHGVGIGLYMSRLVAEHHGGALRLAPTESGRGARFELVLPYG